MTQFEIEPPGTYRPQYRLRWRGLVRALDRFPRAKRCLAGALRGILKSIFDPSMVTTERVVEYPFVYANLADVMGFVLDIGCAHSGFPMTLASRGYRVVGIDFLPYPYRHSNLRMVQGDATRAPFRDQTFDAVLAISTIEHIGLAHYGDPVGRNGDEDAIREIARILRPSGRALVTVPFGRPLIDTSKRVYDPMRLRALLAPLRSLRIEYAWSQCGLWAPCSEAEAASVDWNGPDRAVALVVAAKPSRAERAP